MVFSRVRNDEREILFLPYYCFRSVQIPYFLFNNLRKNDYTNGFDHSFLENKTITTITIITHFPKKKFPRSSMNYKRVTFIRRSVEFYTAAVDISISLTTSLETQKYLEKRKRFLCVSYY